MSYNLKTLIVFDTNSLRSTEAGEVAYSFFAFGRPFQIIEEFIIENKLSNDIHIAIPTWAIEELKDQKQRQYKTDIADFQKLAKRLSGLPDIPEILLPETEFDCANYVGEKAKDYLAQKDIKLLEIKETAANSVLQSMMARVMREETKKAPFAHSGKYKDAGFKDNVVWESLMSFENIIAYDKIIFLTKDGDYKNCEIEFKEKWQRHISILKDENNVITELKKDYENYITNRKIFDFCEKDNFKEYLNSLLKSTISIQLEESEFKIEEKEIKNYCSFVTISKDEESDFEMPLIESEIQVAIIDATLEDFKFIPIKAKTLLSDFETLGIEETTFEPNLV